MIFVASVGVPSFNVVLACLGDHFGEEITFTAVRVLEVSQESSEKLPVRRKLRTFSKEKFRHMVAGNNDSDLYRL